MGVGYLRSLPEKPADRLADDGSMTAIAASAGRVVFIPKDDGNSYFYESFDCQQAVTEGYGAVQFTVNGPAGGSVDFELQTTVTCSEDRANYKSSYTVVSDLTGGWQTITLPLEGFDNEPNYDALVGLVWSGFSQKGIQWSVGNITLVCGGQGTGRTWPLEMMSAAELTYGSCSNANEVDHPSDDNSGDDSGASHHIPAWNLLEPFDR
jgi:hypothetical protein